MSGVLKINITESEEILKKLFSYQKNGQTQRKDTNFIFASYSSGKKLLAI